MCADPGAMTPIGAGGNFAIVNKAVEHSTWLSYDETILRHAMNPTVSIYLFHITKVVQEIIYLIKTNNYFTLKVPCR